MNYKDNSPDSLNFSALNSLCNAACSLPEISINDVQTNLSLPQTSINWEHSIFSLPQAYINMQHSNLSLQQNPINMQQLNLSLQIKIKARTRRTHHSAFVKPAYIQTNENNYPSTFKNPGIIDCGGYDIVNTSKTTMFIISFHLPLDMENVSAIAHLDWNVPASIYSKFPIRTQTNEGELQSDNLLSLSTNTMYIANNNLVRISPTRIDNQVDFIFYIVKNSPRRPPRYCYLYIDIEINDVVVNIAKYFVIGHDHKYSSGKKVMKFINSAFSKFK